MLRLLKHKDLVYAYKLFGLVSHSNLSLPGIPPEQDSSETCDLVLHLGASPYAERENETVSGELTYVSSDANGTGEPALHIWKVGGGAFVRMAYDDGTQFWLDRAREHIWATWPDHLSIESVTSYLLGPVLGLLLRLRGVICLHASAVAIEDRGVVFVGSAGAGKSTTAAAFSMLGYAVLSDDISRLEERASAFYVHSAHPQLCLWPESVEMLYGNAEVLPSFSPAWEKRRLTLGEQGTRFENRVLPLSAVYVLGERRSDPAPYLEAMGQQAALLALVADSYANKVLDRELRAREFKVLGRLVSTVPVRRLCASDNANQLKDLCRVIHEDLASLDLPFATTP
jgi:hypothetical protein